MQEFLDQIIVIDTETTGVDTKHDDVIEFSSNTGAVFTTKYQTSREIPAESSAVHWISNSDVKDATIFDDHAIELLNLLNSKNFIVGHNLNFDIDILYHNLKRTQDPKSMDMEVFHSPYRRICTLELAKKLYAEDEEFVNLKLGYLWFKLKVNEKYPDVRITPHKAEDDVLMCKLVLISLVEELIKRGLVDSSKELGEELVGLCLTPMLYTKMPFGKHKGQLVQEVPTSYFHWLVNNSEVLNEEMPTFDKDLAHTVCHELERRMNQK